MVTAWPFSTLNIANLGDDSRRVVRSVVGCGELSSVEIQAMVSRLGEWEPDLDESEIRAIIKTALHYYGQGPDADDIGDSITAIKEALRRSQRLIVLDDLITIAKADGPVTDAERDIVESLSAAWHIDVRIAY